MIFYYYKQSFAVVVTGRERDWRKDREDELNIEYFPVELNVTKLFSCVCYMYTSKLPVAHIISCYLVLYVSVYPTLWLQYVVNQVFIVSSLEIVFILPFNGSQSR